MVLATLEQENHARDAEFNRAMHGQSAQSRGGFAALCGKDSAAHKAAVDEYFKHWDNKSAEDETEETRAVSNPSLLLCRSLA
jgi:sterol 24-C-methyltransferase